MGWNFSFGHMRYGMILLLTSSHDPLYGFLSLGSRWKKHRRMFHRQFQQSVAPIYWPIQKREAHTLLRRLLHSPENLDYHLRQ